jgi:hypothetical protein
MLIGGMTFSGGADDANLYLFLTARVQELRDDETAEPDEPAAAEPGKGEEPDAPPEQEGN